MPITIRPRSGIPLSAAADDMRGCSRRVGRAQPGVQTGAECDSSGKKPAGGLDCRFVMVAVGRSRQPATDFVDQPEM